MKVADNVYISGADFGGHMPLWATQTTQEQILETLSAMLRHNASLSKISDSVDKLVQNSDEDTDEQLKALREIQETINSGGDAGGSSEDMSGMFDDIIGANERGSRSTKISSDLLSHAMREAGFNVGKLTSDIGKAGVSLTFGVAKSLANQYEMYARMNAAGIVLGVEQDGTIMGLRGINKELVNVGMSFKDVTELSGRYHSVMNVVGIKTFLETTRAIKDAGNEFGLKTTETAEYLAEYMDQQRMAGILRNQLDANIAAAAAERLEETQKFARALGMSREELEKQRKGAIVSTDFLAAMALLPQDIKDAVLSKGTDVMAILDKLGGEFSTLFIKLVGSGGLPSLETTPMRAAMITAGKDDAYQTLVEMSKGFHSGTISKDKTNELLLKFVEQMKSSESTGEQARLSGIAYNRPDIVSPAILAATQQANALSENLLSSLGDKSISGKLKDAEDAGVYGKFADASALIAGLPEKLIGIIPSEHISDLLKKFADSVSDATIALGNMGASGVENVSDIFGDWIGSMKIGGNFDGSKITQRIFDAILSPEVMLSLAGTVAVGSRWKELSTFAGKASSSILGLVSGSSSIGGMFDDIGRAFVQFGSSGGIVSKFLSITKKLPVVGTIIGATSGFVDSFLNIFDFDKIIKQGGGETNYYGRFAFVITNIVSSMLKGLSAIPLWVAEFVANRISTLSEWVFGVALVGDGGADLIDPFNDLMDMLSEYVSVKANQLGEYVTNLWDNIVSWFGDKIDFFSDMIGMGEKDKTPTNIPIVRPPKPMENSRDVERQLRAFRTTDGGMPMPEKQNEVAQIEMAKTLDGVLKQTLHFTEKTINKEEMREILMAALEPLIETSVKQTRYAEDIKRNTRMRGME